MKRISNFEISGTGLVFLVYAVLAWTAGLLLLAFGPLWFRIPYVDAAPLRIAAAGIGAAGCFAVPIGRVADPEARRRAMRWFGGGHALLCIAAAASPQPLWNTALGDGAVTILAVLAVCFLSFAGLDDATEAGGGASVLSLFGTPGSAPALAVSRYEREIREAAGREERNRLARDLHDSIKQQLFAIQTAAATAQTRFEPDPEGARGALAQVRSSAREAMTEMEVLLDQLRAAPLENVGLVEALKQHCEALGYRTGAHVHFEVGDLPANAGVPQGAQQALFRIAQEALSNVARHARASNVRVSLGSAADRLTLTVEDDGAGFDAGAPHSGMGIRNMRDRAAEFGGVFNLETRAGGGVRLSAAIPFAAADARVEALRQVRNEGLALVLMVVVAVGARSGAVAGIAAVWCFRFVRSVAIWRNTQAAREVVR